MKKAPPHFCGGVLLSKMSMMSMMFLTSLYFYTQIDCECVRKYKNI